uniref:Uncharacterized protein n=1 Tax=Pelodiscus sinensis TaxID=13735 RepID=K7EZ08_PELSI
FIPPLCSPCCASDQPHFPQPPLGQPVLPPSSSQSAPLLLPWPVPLPASSPPSSSRFSHPTHIFPSQLPAANLTPPGSPASTSPPISPACPDSPIQFCFRWPALPSSSPQNPLAPAPSLSPAPFWCLLFPSFSLIPTPSTVSAPFPSCPSVPSHTICSILTFLMPPFFQAFSQHLFLQPPAPFPSPSITLSPLPLTPPLLPLPSWSALGPLAFVFLSCTLSLGASPAPAPSPLLAAAAARAGSHLLLPCCGPRSPSPEPARPRHVPPAGFKTPSRDVTGPSS